MCAVGRITMTNWLSLELLQMSFAGNSPFDEALLDGSASLPPWIVGIVHARCNQLEGLQKNDGFTAFS